MLKNSIRNWAGTALRVGLLTLCLSGLARNQALCQYRTTETTPLPNQTPGVAGGNDAPAPNNNSNSGPVRLARFAYIKGNVTWRPDSGSDWAQATPNLPIRQGAQVWVAGGGRADIQFDDGSELRMANGALLTLQTLYSDADGEFTQIVLRSGLVNLSTRHDHAVYQIDAPIGSVMTGGLCKFRLGVDNGLELAVRRGAATVEDHEGKATVNQGQYLYLADANSTIAVRNVPTEDSWDHWNDARDHYLYDDVPTYHHVPSSIALVSGDLDSYGDWHQDPHYGWTWAPHVHRAHWRPYSDGHWTWVEPYGWTWVATDDWGWAPYHYGTWVSASYGWAWVPGPETQYWSPAVVSFSDYNGSVCWAPLAPAEVHYPSVLSVGFSAGSWSAFFSIGQAGCYYPAGPTFCAGRPFDNGYVNHFTYVNNITNITNIYNNAPVNRRFVPYNARYAAGATIVAAAAFAGRGGYRPAVNAATYFTRGHVAGAPPAGHPPVFGVPSVRPTRLAMTPTRSFGSNIRPPAALARRSVFAGARPSGVRPALAVLAGAHPAPRATGSFAAPNARTGAPAHNARTANALNTHNTAAVTAAVRARAALGMTKTASSPAGNGRPNGSFAARQPHAVSAPRPTSHANVARATPNRSVAPSPASRSHTNNRPSPARHAAAVTSASRPRSAGSFSRPQQPHAVSAPSHARSRGNSSQPAHARSVQASHPARPAQRSVQRQSAPRPAPQHRSAPPQQRSAPPQARPAPQQRSAPPQRPAPQQRSAPPQERDRRGR